MPRIPLLLLLSILAMPVQAADLAYSYMRIGNALDKVTETTAGTVLMGGSVDVDAAFKWMCARSGDGDFLVVRTKDDDAYNPYIKELCPNANSVATLIIPSVAAAHDEFVIRTISQAEAVFISGGDQSEYINFWQGTPVQHALNESIANDTPIGGTSAGLHVLTQFVYSAQERTGVTSNQALADPFNKKMTFERDFVTLPYLKGVIADSHYFKRDRIGRNLSFLCRIYDKGWSETPRSIAVDNRTALLIDAEGQAKVVGDRAAYFLQAHGAPQSCSNERPLTYEDVGVYRVQQDVGSFDLSQWQGQGGYDYAISAIQGQLTSTQDDDSSY
jgi:cyanophycinase